MKDEIGLAILAEVRLAVAELRRLNERLAEREARTLPERPVSPAEFARMIGKHRRTVLNWIARGKLHAKREGKTVLISPIAVRKFLNPSWEEMAK